MRKNFTQLLTLCFFTFLLSFNTQACTASFTYYSIGCDSIRFHASPTTATGYYWTWGDNTTLSTTVSNPEHTYPGPGTYIACVIVYTATDTCDHCDTVIVTCNSSPCNAQWTNYHINNPDSVHFYPTGTGALGWRWTFGDSSGSTAQDPWHLYNAPGTYTVCLTAFYSNDTCTWCDTVIVPQPSTCNAEFVHYQVGNNPDSIHFYPYSTNALSYYWTFGDSTSSTLLNPTHTYPGPGTYTVCLTVHYSTDSCTWCDTVIIAGSNNCNATWGNYNLSSNPDSVHFYANESNAINYYWTFGDSTTGTGQYPWHEYPGPGTYQVCLTVQDANGYCTSCDTVIVPASSACIASFTHYSIGGDSVRFHASPTTAIGYYWSWGDNTYLNTTISNPAHTYPGPGTYYACLTVYTATDTCDHCDTVIVTGNSPCNAEFGHYHLNNADSVHFYANENGAITYYWNFGDSTTGTGQYPWHQFPGPGTYNVCLTVHDSSGYCTWCDTVIVPAPPTCNAEFIHYPYGNNPDSMHFWPSSTNALGYYWSFGDNTYSTILNPTHVYAGPGTYNVCLTVFFSNDTCTWCDTVIIATTPPPPCHAEFSHYTLSNPDSVHYYPTYTGAIAWHWTFGDGDTSSLQYPWHYYAAPGTYQVCLIAYYPTDTCDWCDSIVVGNTTCNTHFGHYTLNSPDSVHFYPTGSSAVSYHWDFGDGDTSNLQYPWHDYAASGTYYVCLTANYTSYSCTWCDSITIIIPPPPTCNAEFSYYFLTNSDSLHFYPLVAGAISYYWNFGDSTTSSLQYPWHLFSGPGTYYVCLTATYSNGTCTWCDYVIIGSQNSFYQMAENPLLDRFDFGTFAVGVPERQGSETVSVFPNPASDILHVQRQSNNAVDFILYDLNGRLILNRHLKEVDSAISIKEIAAGFYFYTLNGTKGFIAKGKIIIAR